MKIYDISPLISGQTPVFPGDCPFSKNSSLSFKNGDHLEVSSITSTLHIGAHADAPSHFHSEGRPIHERDLSLYLGPCQVISVNIEKGKRIYPEDVKTSVSAPRVLFKSSSFPNYWVGDFNSLSPELLKWLFLKKVKLVGIDTPSIDPADDKELPSHLATYKYDMAILEGLDLSKVADGCYTLIALPLNLFNAEASPVRAVLVEKWN